jgi:hypothetical protein
VVLAGQCPLPALTKQFSIGVVYVSPVMFENPNDGLRALRQSLADAGVKTSEVWTGDRLRTGSDCQIEMFQQFKPPARKSLRFPLRGGAPRPSRLSDQAAAGGKRAARRLGTA